MAEQERQPDSSSEPSASPDSPARWETLRTLGRQGISRWQALSATSQRAVLAGSAAGFVAVLGLVLWLSLRDPGPPPGQQMKRALELLDRRGDLTARQRALEISRQLSAREYRSPDFAGATEFIQGIVAFRYAEDTGGVERKRQAARAVAALRAAENQALDASRRAEWSFALGSSLFFLKRSAEARPFLEEAVETFEPAKLRAGERLVEAYLDLKTPESLEKALTLNTTLLEWTGAEEARRDRLALQRGRVLLALGRAGDAEQAISRLSPAVSGSPRVSLLRARILMARGRLREARELLQPIARDVGLDQTVPREASYLLGVCAARQGEVEQAIASFERTAERFPRSQEGVAAGIRGAVLLRRDGRHEEAYAAYRRALRAVGAPERFRNRWLSLKEFRQAILDAWNAWVEQGQFEQAIDLAGHMTPVFPVTQAADLAARANQLWAERLAEAIRSAPFSEQVRRRGELRRRWRQSGRAFARLAEALQENDDRKRFLDVLWTSAEHFRKGHADELALRQLTRFINARPEKRLALALVRRAEVLMNLDRLDEALEHLRHVVENYPTDAAAFGARHLLGCCYLERDEPRRAEETWRKLLASPSLEPAAQEWRLALFSLGRLLYRTAEMQRKRAASSPENDKTADASDQPNRERTSWDEAIRRLDEYVKRYPGTEQAVEARYLLGKSLQRRAAELRRRVTRAETETSRNELRLAAGDSLRRALEEFLRLRDQLGDRARSGQLDRYGRTVLQSSVFEIAHTRYALGRYEQAVADYREAINRYPENPRVLVAYLQMANCQDRLDRPVEARSVLEQARIVMQQLPDAAFERRTSHLSREEWKTWLERAARLTAGPSSSAPAQGPNAENEQ